MSDVDVDERFKTHVAEAIDSLQSSIETFFTYIWHGAVY